MEGFGDVFYIYENGVEILVCEAHKRERCDNCFLDFKIMNDEARLKGKVKSQRNASLGKGYKLFIGTKVEKIILKGPFPNNNKYGHIVGKQDFKEKCYQVKFDTGEEEVVPISQLDNQKGWNILKEINPWCAVCQSENKLSKCSKCRSVYYCSSECQLKDWSEHKKICK
jgi:hypothetical protein